VEVLDTIDAGADVFRVATAVAFGVRVIDFRD